MAAATKKQNPNKRSLLILSCSARKQAAIGKVGAWELYDGVSFRVVKRLQRQGQLPNNVDILILSAKHGLIHSTQKIAFYDKRMTREVAMRQAARNCAFLRRYLRVGSYEEVFVNAGQSYLMALQPIESWLPDGVTLIVAEGGIGKKIRQMKRWLLVGD